ncbi:response regulator [Ancylothrix sp. C2]|uniref:hybrid sensor histidine kinase/response regulator n=1 Tax=Ancylothrix sp. D3o TaxID=2953691 RepID=UPI0021BA9805|nr:response regulator [Ancylothrix sp. D3o]MCT7949514.1 response regulator [Ancylothrix sp. D3o]
MRYWTPRLTRLGVAPIMEETLKILVVDDDQVDRMAVRRALQSARVRMELSEAPDCATALATLYEQTFDCVFLDYLLPDGDGLTLVKEIRSAGFKMPLVVLTGQGDEQIAVDLMKAGASDYLSKAKVSSENLSKSLHNVVRLHKAEMQAIIANQQKQESEERYRLVLEGANDGIWDWHIGENQIYWNDRLFEITGLAGGQFAGTYEAFCELLHPDDKQTFIEALEAHLQRNIEFNVELRLRHTSGQYRYCMARARARRTSTGEPFRMSGTITDITERKQAEEALRFLAEASPILASSLDYKTTLAGITKLVVPNRADLCFFDVVTNDNQLQRIGCFHNQQNPPEIFNQIQNHSTTPTDKNLPLANLGTGFEAIFIPDINQNNGSKITNPAHQELIEKLQIRSLITIPLVAHNRKLGTLTWALVQGSVRTYTQEDLSLMEELGRRAALAIENSRLYREAQEANRVKDEFLATLSHELRTPLNAMLGWAQLLKSRKLDQEKTIKAVEVIERNARSQTQMIEDLLDVSRIITGKLRLNFRSCNLLTVVEAALDTVRPTASAKGIELISYFDPQIGEVKGDSDRLQQVVWNLLSNAVKFTPPGGRVECSLIQTDHRAIIQVKDSGIGIKPEFLPYVFERFRQADSTTSRAYNGLGLGLAIVRHLVELHGGSVAADSGGDSTGATFRVSIPFGESQPVVGGVKAAAILSKDAQQQQKEALFPTVPLAGLQLVVVDDELDTRELICVMLKQYGAEVRAAASAQEALALLDELVPDVLVSDIGMPFQDGYAFIAQVRQRSPERGGLLPALALTAYARDSDRALALGAGFQLHLAKPVEPVDLARAVAQLAGREVSLQSSEVPEN